ncbi:MerR family transcriptional regulator [Aureispira anguillae]|uniref:MerR family transcriptional regulator n=1 Tax=Aureispira anguillae TaxID=2864201 RepID=A0A915YJH6_9BACT|nr:MerR family transcriptional regulator [Aureispira anguillae]BDS14164.1 MerR family transcriptional regulator [Aureispira anguillae]
MANYSIRDLAKLSGIKAHTIRIWEQRYSIIEPKRTASNIRYYTDKDLKFLMNIAFLNRKGIRISKIAKMTQEEIAKQVDHLSKTNVEHTDNFQNLAMAMMELDGRKICGLLSTCFERDGVEDTILNVLVPFLEKASLLWLTGSISAMHEQFASCVIRRKILTAISKINIKTSGEKKKVLLYLPEGDQQELYLIFVEYLLKKRNVEVVYLGTKVGIEDLQLAASIHQPNYIYTIISERHKCYVPECYIRRLCKGMNAPHLLISGFQHTPKIPGTPDNITILEDLNELIKFFSS